MCDRVHEPSSGFLVLRKIDTRGEDMPKHPASKAENIRRAIGRGSTFPKAVSRNSTERAFAREGRRDRRSPPGPPEKGGLPLSVWLIVGAAMAIAILVLVFH
jgi:hypothetical protein